MATEKYKFGKGKHGAKAVKTDLPDGEHHAVGISKLHVLVVPDGKGWFAQAFEIDYGVQGNSIEEVKKRFEEGLAATIQHNVDIFDTITNILHPNPDWYALKAETEGAEYDYSCVSVFPVAAKLALTSPFSQLKMIEYETVRRAAA
jgi:hypothetical protein